jgi:hypothetical protein
MYNGNPTHKRVRGKPHIYWLPTIGWLISADSLENCSLDHEMRARDWCWNRLALFGGAK